MEVAAYLLFVLLLLWAAAATRTVLVRRRIRRQARGRRVHPVFYRSPEDHR